jgi:hypothetical protein
MWAAIRFVGSGRPSRSTHADAPPPQTQQTLLDTFSVARYHEVMERIGGRLGPDYVADELSLEGGGDDEKKKHAILLRAPCSIPTPPQVVLVFLLLAPNPLSLNPPQPIPNPKQNRSPP